MVDGHNQATEAYPSTDGGCLADYRAAVERLHDETVGELGRQPMAPETASMIAVFAASLPIVAALRPGTALTLDVWHVALILAGVWFGVFLLQRSRYERFQAAFSRKVVDHAGAPPAIPVRDFRYRSSGHTTGA
jgi:hypothetical protein